ncbi:hypothetical protein [Hymenobacter translucens]|uniref:hypothetical protein n=1 Tax=Hymenobacter translucens TaxID=2886507 RepID=UPI001D0DE549|nr:hypothetical protein [Hymenobacter translucens]
MLSKLALTGAFALLLAGAAQPAQAQINININPPSWGPALPQGSQYYYIPEVGGYYDVPAQRYIVQRNGKWMRVASLSGYNPANFHPVVINYVGAQPWGGYAQHKAKYGHPHGMPPGQAKKMRSNQVMVVDGAPGQGRGNGHGNGHGNGNGKGHGKGNH